MSVRGWDARRPPDGHHKQHTGKKGLPVKIRKLFAAAGVAAICTSGAQAQGWNGWDDWYVGGSIGVNSQMDSDNSGQTGAFTTGNTGDGTTIDVADGTAYGWSTEFDSGLSVQGEFGVSHGSGARASVELTWSQADVDTHTDVTLGGGAIGSLDAAALAGAPDPLGVTVADLVADGQGEITSLGLFANAYYDFNTAGQFQPYIGGGIGIMDTDVEYAPSGVDIIDDGETAFAWQLKAGATWRVNETFDIYGEYAYRASDDIEVSNDLFPGTLEIENQQNVFSIGARVRFG